MLDRVVSKLPGYRKLGGGLTILVYAGAIVAVWMVLSTAAGGSFAGEGGPIVLVTGGAGYIGSHTIVELIKADYRVVCVDNFVNSKAESLHRVRHILGSKNATKLLFYQVDLRDPVALEAVFQRHPDISSVIHFAGLKAVGESVELPLLYYDNNLRTTTNLLECMRKYNVRKLVFSSSATVYGFPEKLPLTEDSALRPTNPYGRTKYFIEEILRDEAKAWRELTVVLLRYFNPVGAHESGLIGEDPRGVPNNLLPYVAQVAVGRLPHVRVMGTDYKTKDGTGVRDYIHVVDLALGHLAALKWSKPGAETFNLGTGVGYSVLEMIDAMKVACKCDVKYEKEGRRPGDVAEVYADPEKATKLLKWKATKGLQEMCSDLWNFQSKNPQGY